MHNHKLQEYLNMSWGRVLPDKKDVFDLFKTLKIDCLENLQILSRTPSINDRLTMIIGASNASGKSFKIIIDATSGIPTWGQFIDATYDQGKDTDVKIILYGTDSKDQYAFDLPAGGSYEIGKLVGINNRCGVKTILVKGIDMIGNSLKKMASCEVIAGPDDVTIDQSQKLPSKRQVQEAEFWVSYYTPQWLDDFPDFDEEITSGWSPGYPMRHNLKTEASWTDEGFYISLSGEPGCDAIRWIWENKKAAFESAYPGHEVMLRLQEGKPYAISVIIERLSMTDLINSKPGDKWSYGEMVYSQESQFCSIADGVIGDYDEVSNKEAA